MAKKHIHIFKHPEPNGRISIGKCSCGKIDKAFNSIDINKSSPWRNLAKANKRSPGRPAKKVEPPGRFIRIKNKLNIFSK